MVGSDPSSEYSSRATPEPASAALSEIWPVHSSGSHVSVTVGPAPSPTTFSRAGAEALPAASEATAVSGNGATEARLNP